MEVQSPNVTLTDDQRDQDTNTTTFLIGFGVLLIFVVIGVLASAFLCMTLKKDQYLWEAETQLQEKRYVAETGDRDGDKSSVADEKHDRLSLSN